MRGAVIHGMTRKKRGKTPGLRVKSRIARGSYGFEIRDEWNASIHSIEDKFWNHTEEQWMVANQLDYFISEVQILLLGFAQELIVKLGRSPREHVVHNAPLLSRNSCWGKRQT